MAITPASFKTLFPEFAAEDDARIQIFIDEAVTVLNESYWGTKYDYGLYYYTAHTLALATITEDGSIGSMGLIGSKGVDGTSISYTNATPNSQSENYWASTSYGQKYLQLMDSLGVPAFVV
jgi:hypothetical protein